MRIGTQEMIMILIVVILIFGPTQIPKLTRIFGKSVKSFRDGMTEDEADEPTAEVEAKQKAPKASVAKSAENGATAKETDSPAE